MNKFYYIENYGFYVENDRSENKLVVANHNKNLVVINSDQDKLKLIQNIERKELMDDKEFKYYLDKAFPDLSKKITSLPINREEIENYFRKIYSYDLPRDLFEGDNVISIFKNVISFIIKKIEIDFYLTNIRNGKLEYDNEYPIKEVLHFYYKMLYLNFTLEELHSLLVSSLNFQQNTFLREFFLKDRKISKKELILCRQLFNGTANGILDFKEGIESIQNQIVNNKRRIKRIGNIFLTKEYEEEERKLINLTNNLIEFCEKQIETTLHQKKELDRIYFENKGNFKLSDVNSVLEIGEKIFKLFQK